MTQLDLLDAIDVLDNIKNAQYLVDLVLDICDRNYFASYGNQDILKIVYLVNLYQQEMEQLLPKLEANLETSRALALRAKPEVSPCALTNSKNPLIHTKKC